MSKLEQHNTHNNNSLTSILPLILKHGTTRKFKRNEVLVSVGEDCKNVFFIKSGGFLRQFYSDESESLHTISFHLPNHRPFVTINESYFADQPSMYEIRAFKTSEIVELKKGVITEMNQQHPFLKEFHDQRILQALLFENEFKSRLISYSPKAFYQYLCQQYPEVIKNVPSKYIADVMKISPEWLSKLKRSDFLN